LLRSQFYWFNLGFKKNRKKRIPGFFWRGFDCPS
jgi:hypothetical protein